MNDFVDICFLSERTFFNDDLGGVWGLHMGLL